MFLRARARRLRLVLFHHDPWRTDVGVDRLLSEATERAAAAGSSLEVLAAAEGMQVHLTEHGPPLTIERGPEAPRLATRPRLLLVEDDDGVAETLNAVLEDDGYELRRARDGRQAVGLIHEMPFDLVILDLEMPVMDGYDVCRTLRSDKRWQTLPILVLSVHSHPEDILAGFEAGVSDYMIKPFSEAQLRARARSWLTRTGR